jgi:hypothetical protein
MRHDTEAFLLLLRQRASDNADLTAWIARSEASIGGVMDMILAARGDDAGRFIGGARKDKGMFTQMLVAAGVVSAESLAALEAQGEDAAFREITRDKLIPKRTPASLKALGDSSPVAFLKVALRDMIAPRPYNSPEARAKFVAAANAVNSVFDTPFADTHAFMRDLQLRYFYRVALGDMDAVILSSKEVAAAVADPTRHSMSAYMEDHGFVGYGGLGATNGVHYYVFTKKERPYRYHRGETDEQKKNRESIEKPLGSRFYDAVEQGLRFNDKTKWDEIVLASRNITPDDWSWAAPAGGVEETVPEDERAEPLKREEVLEPPDCARMKEEGDSIGAAYLYVWAYKNLIPKRSPATKAGRAAYEAALAEFDLVMSDLSDRRKLANMIAARSSFLKSPRTNVLPAAPLDTSTVIDARAYVAQEGMNRASEDEKNKMFYAYLSEELGVPVAVIFSGSYAPKGDHAYYYRVALPDDDVTALVEKRTQTRAALKAISPDLYSFLEGEWHAGKKFEAAHAKAQKLAYAGDWSEIDAMCAALSQGSGGGGRSRFTEPDRGVLGPRVGPAVSGPHTSNSIERTTGLYGVEYGDWMNEADKATVNVSLAEALHDLADMLDLPLPAVSLGKRLAIGLGSRGQGHASAHYEPLKKVINMTRTRGSGALAHEWGHALDHWLADAGQAGRVVNGSLDGRFATVLDGTGGMQGVDVTQEERKAVNEAIMRVMDILVAGKQDYEDARLRRWEESHPRPSDYYGDTYREWSRKRSEFRDTLRANARKNDMLTASKNAGGNYWQRNEEMFARAWESFILDKLTKQKRSSGYLVRGTDHPVYPQGEQRERLYGEFTAFLDTLRPILRRLAVRPNGRARVRKPWEMRR